MILGAVIILQCECTCFTMFLKCVLLVEYHMTKYHEENSWMQRLDIAGCATEPTTKNKQFTQNVYRSNVISTKIVMPSLDMEWNITDICIKIHLNRLY